MFFAVVLFFYINIYSELNKNMYSHDPVTGIKLKDHVRKVREIKGHLVDYGSSPLSVPTRETAFDRGR